MTGHKPFQEMKMTGQPLFSEKKMTGPRLFWGLKISYFPLCRTMNFAPSLRDDILVWPILITLGNIKDQNEVFFTSPNV